MLEELFFAMDKFIVEWQCDDCRCQRQIGCQAAMPGILCCCQGQNGCQATTYAIAIYEQVSCQVAKHGLFYTIEALIILSIYICY